MIVGPGTHATAFIMIMGPGNIIRLSSGQDSIKPMWAAEWAREHATAFIRIVGPGTRNNFHYDFGPGNTQQLSL
jgi:hypothetical protein